MKAINTDRTLKGIKELENVLKISFVLIITILAISSCSKSDNDVDDDLSFTQGTMEAKINGELIVFDQAGGIAGSFDLENSCNELFEGISGSMYIETPDQHSIHLRFMPSQGVGTYDTLATYYKGGGTNELAIPYYKRPSFNTCRDVSSDYSEEGEVTITSVENGRYKGTFHFTGWSCDGEKVIITDGKFDVAQESELAIKFCD